MQVEESSGKRLLRPVLITLLLAASLAIPIYLWVTRGRALPLRIVLDPPTHVVRVGEVVPLRLRLLPPVPAEEIIVTWEGEGIQRASRPADTAWKAPARPGTFFVTVKARRSGTMVKDSVSFQVVSTDPKSFDLVRPARTSMPPEDPKKCDGSPPELKTHNRPCAGGNVVLQLSPEGPFDVWHSHEAWSARGRWAELVLPEQKPWPVVETVVLDRTRGCAWKLQTEISGDGCSAGPSNAVFADFSWQLVSPGYFRFAAKPARAPAPRFGRFKWDFGGPTPKSSKTPRTTHRFKGPPRRFRLVKLEVSSPEGKAETTRLVVDRTVEESAER